MMDEDLVRLVNFKPVWGLGKAIATGKIHSSHCKSHSANNLTCTRQENSSDDIFSMNLAATLKSCVNFGVIIRPSIRGGSSL